MESNHRPRRYKCRALTAELQARGFFVTSIWCGANGHSIARYGQVFKVAWIWYTGRYMKEQNTDTLIAEAKDHMAASTDPIHDLSHVTRVAAVCTSLARDMALSGSETNALVLAAWWHDAGRTITKKSSFIWMIFFDDLFSAFMLLRAACRARLLNPMVGKAIRIILCQSFGSGKLFARLLLRRRTSLLLDVLVDADNLDILYIQRIEIAITLARGSRWYRHAYRILVWWNLCTAQMVMRTRAARVYLRRVLEELLVWMQYPRVREWHEQLFGSVWCDRTILRINLFLSRLDFSGRFG